MFNVRLLWLINLVLLLFILTSSATRINCESPQTFSVTTEIDKQIYVYGAEITVEYDRNELAVYEYPLTNAVNILLNNSIVSVTGYVVYDDEVLSINALKTATVLNTTIAGSAKLVSLNNTNNQKFLSACSIYLAKTPKINIGLPRELEVEILHRVASCLKPSICSKLDSITAKDVQNAENHPFSFGALAAIPRQIRNYVVSKLPSSNSVSQSNLQSIVNIIVDIVIAGFVERIEEKNERTIEIPEISLDITEQSRWKPHGRLEATRGTFSDLTTLTRTKDATLSHNGLRFTASCGFGFSRAKINYEKYKLKYGLSVSGRISATIDDLSLAVTVVIDLSRKPCRIILQELSVEDLGTVKIKMTGLGPFNGFLSKFATWITKKWKEEIVITIERKMREVVQEYLSKFSCENLRP